MFERILLAYDDSDAARAAFGARAAGEIAARFSSVLIAVTVARPPLESVEVACPDVTAPPEEACESAFRGLRVDASARAVTLKKILMVGDPSERLVEIAGRERVDLVVVGRGGVGRLRRWIGGSVSASVLDGVKCPVLVVQPDERRSSARRP